MFTMRHMSQRAGKLSNSCHAGVGKVHGPDPGDLGMSPKPLKFFFFLDVLKCVMLCPLEGSECYMMWLCIVVNTPSIFPHVMTGVKTADKLKIQL